ncbi:MAG: ATP-binding protein [Nitrososphaerota archaeon]|jgi:Histidine kinase-, DNA gyrase B-, and HSP90-like ATPase
MGTALKVHPSFFKEFATKTWVSPAEVVKELVENAFDEDATKVLITILNGDSVCIEDDAGMDQEGVQKFLLLGSPHKRIDTISPKFKRVRTGRYGTGRLSFLTSFEKMKIRTRQGTFDKSLLIDSNSLDKLFTGNSELKELRESPLKRNGTELTISGSKVQIDEPRLIKEIRKLAVLRHPLFEVSIKRADRFREWDFSSAEAIKAPDIQGHRIPVTLDDGKITGEIAIARRPLSDDERGIAIMIGNHIVLRTSFGFDSKLSRVTGYVRCDNLTSRFADKSAIIEDEEYERFNKQMKILVIDTVIPSLAEYEDVLITREESKIYRQLDKVLGQAVIETLESQEEIEGYEIVETRNANLSSGDTSSIPAEVPSTKESIDLENEYSDIERHGTPAAGSDEFGLEKSHQKNEISTVPAEVQAAGGIIPSGQITTFPEQTTEHPTANIATTKIRKPILKKTFVLKKVGYKVIPYEDESDSRYSFVNENVVFVNKANPTYKAESSRGDEFLLRHIMNIVAQAIAEARHPEGKEALELQNRLISEAIRIHDGLSRSG